MNEFRPLDEIEARRRLDWYRARLNEAEDSISEYNLQMQAMWKIHEECLFNINRLEDFLYSSQGKEEQDQP